MKKYFIILAVVGLIAFTHRFIADHRNKDLSGVAYGGKRGTMLEIIPTTIPYTEENLEFIKSLNLFTIHNKIIEKNAYGPFTVSREEQIIEHYINPEPYTFSENSCEVIPVYTIYKSYDNQSKILREYKISTDTPLALSVKKRLENDKKNIALCKEKKQLELLETLKQTCSKPIKQINFEEYKQCKENNLIK